MKYATPAGHLTGPFSRHKHGGNGDFGGLEVGGRRARSLGPLARVPRHSDPAVPPEPQTGRQATRLARFGGGDPIPLRGRVRRQRGQRLEAALLHTREPCENGGWAAVVCSGTIWSLRRMAAFVLCRGTRKRGRTDMVRPKGGLSFVFGQLKWCFLRLDHCGRHSVALL